MKQVIRFTPGTYTLYYRVAGRPGAYYDSNKITSSITGLLYYYTPTVTSTGWTTISQNFTVLFEQFQTLCFDFQFQNKGDSSILLTDVYITQNTNYLNSTTDITTTNVNTVLPIAGVYGFAPLIPNTQLSSYYARQSNTLFSNSPYYMHGTRNRTGFQKNGVDIGFYFQQTPPYDGSYGYCFETNYTNNTNAGISNIYGTEAKIIWPENAADGQATTTDPIYAYWLYYTFYYSGTANNGTFYAEVDDVAYLYFNNTAIGQITYANTFGNTAISTAPANYYSYTISIVNGLNYIRVACYNAATLCGFYASLKDSGGNVVAVTNSNWTWSITPSPYNTISSYNNMNGALPFNYSPFEEKFYSISGLTYSLGSSTDPQFPLIPGYNVIYFKSGTGTVQFAGYSIKNIFVVGGGAGGSSGGYSYPGLGGGVSNNNVNFIENITFTISVGNGGSGGASGGINTGSTGTQSTCVYAPLSINYVGSGGTVATTNSNSVTGTQYSYNSLYYGGSGGNGSSPGVVNTQGAPLGGGGGGGGVGYYANLSGRGGAGGTGGGISESLTGGASGATSANTVVNASPGTSSPYGGGGGGGGAYASNFGRNGGDGGAGSGTATGGGGTGGTGGTNIKGGGGGGGNGGVNTGGGGGGGGGTDTAFGGGGSGGSGIVIIVYI